MPTGFPETETSSNDDAGRRDCHETLLCDGLGVAAVSADGGSCGGGRTGCAEIRGASSPADSAVTAAEAVADDSAWRDEVGGL